MHCDTDLFVHAIIVSCIIASVDVEMHARDFMEAAKKLQLYFIGLQREDQPSKTETLRKVNKL